MHKAIRILSFGNVIATGIALGACHPADAQRQLTPNLASASATRVVGNPSPEREPVGLALDSSTSQSPSASFAAPPNDAPPVPEDKEPQTNAERAWLGLELETVNNQLRVLYVHPESPAAKARIKAGDIVVRMGTRNLKRQSEYRQLLGTLTPGESVPALLRRNGQTRLTRLTATRYPDRDQLLRARYLGRTAPAISTLQPIQGSLIPSWSQLKGRVVVLEFWASWCSGCRGLTPELNRWENDYEAMGLEVLGVTMDPIEQAALDAKTLGLKYPLFSDENGRITEAFSATALPMLFILDRKGVVRDLLVGYFPKQIPRLEQLIVTLLEE